MKLLTYCVRGKVQGVYFRNETVDKAKALGLTGWVQNNLDGTVGGEAAGEEDKLNEFKEWLWRGPEAAKVLEVKANLEDVEQERFEGEFKRLRGRGAGGSFVEA